MEVYGIRQNWNRLYLDLTQCKKEVVSLNFTDSKSDFEKISKVHMTLVFIAEMCKAQNLNTIGKLNPFKELYFCSNNISAAKEILLNQSSNIKDLELIKNTLDTKLSELAETVKNKELNTIVEIPVENEKDNVFAKLEDIKPKSVETLFYSDINNKLFLEKNELNKILPYVKNNNFALVKGSVAINHFFKERDLANLNFSLVKFPGIAYTHSRRETITPIYIFHDQLLVALNFKPRFKYGKRVKSKKEEFRSREAFLLKMREAIYEETDLLDMLTNSSQKYLYAKAFKGFIFFWFADYETYKALGQLPENTVSLIWE